MFSIATMILLFSFALLGYARVGTFIINRAIFRHRRDRPILKWVTIALIPTFGALTLLFVPLIRERHSVAPSTAAQWGGLWLAFAAGIGLYWIADRIIVMQTRRVPPQVDVVDSHVIALRRGHIHYPLLRRLGLHNDVYDLEVNEFKIAVPALPREFQNYRIAFLSDLHVASFMQQRLYATCLDVIRGHGVDAVILGGDFVTWAKDIRVMAEVLTDGLAARDGSFAVLGNHDYWADADAVIAALTHRGVRFVHNRSVAIRRGDAELHIAGIEEVYRGNPDVDGTLSAIPVDVPRIVVSHHPDIIDKIGDQRIDLLLCGHTHGGQIRAPFFGALLVPAWHEAKYDQGFFQVRNTLMYVGRGVGAVPPVRVLCRPEVPIFDLVRA